MSRDSGRWREMLEDRNKAESKSEGENSDVSPKTPDTETVKDHEVYKSTMQAIRETLVKPVDKKKDSSTGEVQIPKEGKAKTGKQSKAKPDERKRVQKRTQTKKLEPEKKRMKSI